MIKSIWLEPILRSFQYAHLISVAKPARQFSHAMQIFHVFIDYTSLPKR